MACRCGKAVVDVLVIILLALLAQAGLASLVSNMGGTGHSAPVFLTIMADPFIRIKGLTKHYEMGGQVVRALDGLDLEIEAHTFTVVMGPSGSGKSTLLYLLGGLDHATSGEIWVDGQRLDQMDENALALFRRRTMGFVFQSFNLIPSMTAVENVSFPMQFAGVSASKRKEQGDNPRPGGTSRNCADHKPTELSGGQQQRVAIARALVNNPGLILADEPTGNLDTSSGAAIMQVLSDLHLSGRTVPGGYP